MTVRFRALREDEFDEWRRRHTRWYEQDILDHGGGTPEFARGKAEADFAALWPAGFATEGNVLLVVEADGGRIGSVFFAPRERQGTGYVWLYSIEIDEEHRGKGYGRRAMELLEEEVRARGFDRVELNVFGGNERARALYRSLGYEELAVVMGKDVP